jgi:citrate synthase
MVAGLATSVLTAGEYSLALDQTGRFLRETFATTKSAETFD